ncbi:D-alanyl-D-alanine carboxypeptidase family protein [Pseudonocardia nigra]|uniref:D-alanyl-D-alanine carboxypeptidase family protein n=1 Tax=Pseudonocardia nigra TaxID=1921578 RepID=UPI001C5E6845|nr:serine hydrolase [Pseudonocardia nigra]
MRWLGVFVLVTALGAPAAAAVPPQVRPVAAPASCLERYQVPPRPAAVEELGVPAPDPLPWPAEPVGGSRLGTCGDVGPASAPMVGAESWVIADLDTGEVLAGRTPHARHRPASTLKVLTALLALRDLDPAQRVAGTAADTAIDGSKAGIGPGAYYTVRQLLAGLLLSSGNDTAQALARAMGGQEAAVAAMTELAHELGALDTRAATPSGLDGPGMASSAYDLALLFRVAMREPLFAELIATRSVLFPGYGPNPAFELWNNNRMLTRYPGTLGAKAGFTDAARHTLVAAAEQDGRRLVVALMRGEQSPVPMWEQAGELLDWGFSLPASTRPVGVLVDRNPWAPPPAPPVTAAELAAPAAGRAPLAVIMLVSAVSAALLALGLLRVRARR